MDLSDFPALIGAFAFGSAAGILIVGASFVATARLIYRHHKTKNTALFGGIAGSFIMGVAAALANYFILLPPLRTIYAGGSADRILWRVHPIYSDFQRRHDKLHVLYLEVGIGMGTPVICKYPFWQMTNDNPKAVYACLNFNEAYCPVQIEKQSICIDGDSAEVIERLVQEN